MSGKVAEVERDGYCEVMVRFQRRREDFQEQCRAPSLDDPVSSLEICFAGDAAESAEVVGFEEERVRELVFVREDDGGEGEVGV